MDTKSYYISDGPSKTELFAALKRYPKKKVTFEIAMSRTHDTDFWGKRTPLPYFSCMFEMFIRSIEAILMPDLRENFGIDMMKDTWLIEGFIQNESGLFYQLKLMYNTRNHTGSMFLPKGE